jgi:hypothetical protein
LDHVRSDRECALVYLVPFLQVQVWALEAELLRTMLYNIVWKRYVDEGVNEVIHSVVTLSLHMQ